MLRLSTAWSHLSNLNFAIILHIVIIIKAHFLICQEQFMNFPFFLRCMQFFIHLLKLTIIRQYEELKIQYYQAYSANGICQITGNAYILFLS